MNDRLGGFQKANARNFNRSVTNINDFKNHFATNDQDNAMPGDQNNTVGNFNISRDGANRSIAY